MGYDLLSDWMPLSYEYTEENLEFVKRCLELKLSMAANEHGYEILDHEFIHKENTMGGGDPYWPFDTIGLKFKVEKTKEIDDEC